VRRRLRYQQAITYPCLLQAAADARDDAGMVRFCKLLAQLDMPGEVAFHFAQYAGLTVQARRPPPFPARRRPPRRPAP
jgi:hypothetical protein